MAKFKVDFNDKNYNIDEASLATATTALKSHLSTVMSGTGATINLDGTFYNVDSTKLSSATNAFISHLGTISGSGYTVSVNGIEYAMDSAKLSGAISDLESVLGGLNSGSDVNVVLSEQVVRFEYIEEDGMYCSTNTITLQDEIIVGETYTVVFDGTSYICTTVQEGTTIGIMNNNQSIICFKDEYGFHIGTSIEGYSHTVAIYKASNSSEDSEYKLLLSSRTLTGFAYTQDENDVYESSPKYSLTTDATYQLNKGYKYRVIWDGVEYYDVSATYHNDEEEGIIGCVIGDHSLFLNTSKTMDCPFCIRHIPIGVAGNDKELIRYYTSDTENHTIEIYVAETKESGTLINNQTLSFKHDAQLNEIAWQSDYSMFNIIEGEAYSVTWDGVQYNNITAKSAKLFNYYDAVCIGNIGIHTDVEADNSGEPFAIICAPDVSMFNYVITSDEVSTEHTVTLRKN